MNKFHKRQPVKTKQPLQFVDDYMRSVFDAERLHWRQPGSPGYIIDRAAREEEFYFVEHEGGHKAIYRVSELEPGPSI